MPSAPSDLFWLVSRSLLLVFVVSFISSIFYVFKLMIAAPLKEQQERRKSSNLQKRPWKQAIISSLIFLFTFYFLFSFFPHHRDVESNSLDPLHTSLFKPIPIDDSTRALHSTLFIADLHADSLIWPRRSILDEIDWGHVDVPRLIKGNVGLQGFTMGISLPPKMNFEKNERPNIWNDPITLLALVNFWPPAAITSMAERTFAQIRRLEQASSHSEGKLHFIRTVEDFQTYLEVRRENPNITAGYLGIEGLQAIDGDIDNIDRFAAAGVRTGGLTHFFDNEVGGSAHGVEKGGLTELGKKVLQRMEEVGIFVDIAHASEKTVDDVCRLSKRPILSSHTGVRAVCDTVRNLNDAQIRCVARSGGVLGVTFFRGAQCGENLVESIIKSVSYIRNLVGAEFVALGSDFDGFVQTPFDTSQLIQLTQALRNEKFTDQEIRLIMGDNVKNLFLKHLPSASKK